MSAWVDLKLELDTWSDRGTIATFWWRDDDATGHTPALHRLYTLSSARRIPLTLAVIPHAARMDLCTGNDSPDHLRLVQHGYAHVNHAPVHDKKSEFGLHRDFGTVADDISSGFSRIETFPHFFPAFVPPWNRIDSGFYQSLVDSGLQGISTFGFRQEREPAQGLIQTNTHADIVDWHGSRGFAGVELVCRQILDHLIARRAQKCDVGEPTGILTHHLVHDDACWNFLDELFARLKGHRAVRWLDGAEVFST